MAHHTVTAAEWLLSRREELGVKFYEFKWDDAYGIRLFDFEVSIHGGKHVGRGTATDESLAFEKASAEALERLVCFENQISTTGVAAHSIAEAADENATHEALERHLFFSHLRNGSPFARSEPLSAVAGIERALSAQKVRVAWMDVPSPNQYSSSICLIEKNDRQFLGLGFGTSKADVQIHAAIEALRNLAAFDSDPTKFVERAESDPDLWNCRQQFFKDHESAFHFLDAIAHPPTNLRFDVSFEIEELKSKSISDIPLFFKRARLAAVPS